jgi:signal-transduction protein with cAMP-binding, CBS, and nucleotidyltransferase domain
MTLQKYKSLSPRDYDEFLGYMMMEDAPEEVRSKDTWEDDFGNWIESLRPEQLEKYGQLYAQLEAERREQNMEEEIKRRKDAQLNTRHVRIN